MCFLSYLYEHHFIILLIFPWFDLVICTYFTAKNFLAVVEDIYKRRQPLPSMDAVYFIQPTKEKYILYIDIFCTFSSFILYDRNNFALLIYDLVLPFIRKFEMVNSSLGFTRSWNSVLAWVWNILYLLMNIFFPKSRVTEIWTNLWIVMAGPESEKRSEQEGKWNISTRSEKRTSTYLTPQKRLQVMCQFYTL